jgi:6-pyruvoyltetrahydropterin/6-carboxytetrahydropterin synthase
MSLQCELTREVEIRSIHNLVNPQLSAIENMKLYGPCYGQHGHHYKIRVTLSGPIEKSSGFVFDRDRMDRILLATVVDPLDGMDLNQIFPNTACEALARALFLRLKPLFPDGLLKRVGIQETRKNYFEFPAGAAGL